MNKTVFEVTENTEPSGPLVDIYVPEGQRVTLGSSSTPFAFKIQGTQLFLNVTPDYEVPMAAGGCAEGGGRPARHAAGAQAQVGCTWGPWDQGDRAAWALALPVSAALWLLGLPALLLPVQLCLSSGSQTCQNSLSCRN